MDAPLGMGEVRALHESATRGSFSAAARALGITPQGVAKQVDRLEGLAGTRLFNRSRSGVVLTATGRTLESVAELVVAQMDRFEHSVRHAAGGRARVAIAASPTLVEPFLVTELASYVHRGEEELPRVAPTIAMANSDEVREEVLHGRAHLGLAASGPAARLALSSRQLNTLPLMKDEVVVAVASDHEWAIRQKRRDPIYVDEIAATRMATRDPGSNVRLVFDAMLRKRGLELADPRVEVGVGRLVVQEARALGCPALLSQLALRDHREMTIIKAYESTPDGPRRVRVPREFEIVFLDWDRLSPEARELAESLQAAGAKYACRARR